MSKQARKLHERINHMKEEEQQPMSMLGMGNISNVTIFACEYYST